MKAQYTEWIDQYLEGELSPEERREFEEVLQVNPQLREEYALRMALDDYMEAEARMRELKSSPEWEESNADAEEAVKLFFSEVYEIDLDEEMGKDKSQKANSKNQISTKSQADSKTQTESKSQTKYRFGGRRMKRPAVRILTGLGVAAALAGVVLLINISLMTKPPETEVLFARYVEEAKSMTNRSGEVPQDIYNDIFLAIEQYEAKDFDKALQTFDGLEPWRMVYPEISLFKGLIYLEVGENEVAMTLFKDCAKQPGPYRKYARWLRNLAYARLANPDAAFLFIVERSDGFHNLPGHWQNMIRAVNLLGTGRFAEYRQFVNPGADGALILRSGDIIAVCVLIGLFLAYILAILDIIWMRYKREDRWTAILVLLLVPGLGALMYLAVLRWKFRKG